MAAYASLTDLSRTAVDGWSELATHASDSPAVTGDALKELVAGNTPPLAPNDLASAQAAVVRLQALLEDVSRYADTYLNQLYREQIPLTEATYRNTGLPYAVTVIALSRLYGIHQTDEMRKSVASAESYLRDLAKGVASLDAASPSTPDAPGRMVVHSRPSEFNWGDY